LAFQYFDFERTWLWLFQKHVVCIKFDIYVFIVVSSTPRYERLTITPIQLHLNLSITKRHFRPLTLRNPYKTPEHGFREKRSN
jgi:hypothetical protein